MVRMSNAERCSPVPWLVLGCPSHSARGFYGMHEKAFPRDNSRSSRNEIRPHICTITGASLQTHLRNLKIEQHCINQILKSSKTSWRSQCGEFVLKFFKFIKTHHQIHQTDFDEFPGLCLFSSCFEIHQKLINLKFITNSST
jgi:hypothetical protein